MGGKPEPRASAHLRLLHTSHSQSSVVRSTPMSDIKFYKLDAAFAALEKFDHCAKPDAFIEVALWHNCDGFDVHLNNYGEQSFKLTWREFEALKKLIKELDK